jgi:hypothetical protein
MSDPNRAAEKAAKLAAKQSQYEAATAGLTFTPWPKIARLNREIVITEKIDGTNAAISIVEMPSGVVQVDGSYYHVYAQSRNRILTPENDNFGFARWVRTHAATLVRALGPGLHFGEWWGVGIGRGYDLRELRFSLFNVAKWGSTEGATGLANARLAGAAIYTVPVLYTGPWTGNFGYIDGPLTEKLGITQWLKAPQDWPAFDENDMNPRPRFAPNFILEWLQRNGSFAASGFKSPEGIVVFHKASGNLFKVTVEHDEEYKGAREKA